MAGTLVEILSGVHQARVVHRDVSPFNAGGRPRDAADPADRLRARSVGDGGAGGKARFGSSGLAGVAAAAVAGASRSSRRCMRKHARLRGRTREALAVYVQAAERALQ